jgi:hypothetical protein
MGEEWERDARLVRARRVSSWATPQQEPHRSHDERAMRLATAENRVRSASADLRVAHEQPHARKCARVCAREWGRGD